MAEVLVLADDLTGANATGARFARAGLRAVTVAPERAAEVAPDYDVVVVNTDSRHLPSERAAGLVAGALRAVGPVRLAVKRTDTTLRGNVGAEIEAAYRALAGAAPAGTRVRALLAPAFPASGRVTVDGVQLLDGVPLERTELALDPLSPLRTSVVADIVAEQTPLPLRHLPIRCVSQGRAAIAAALAAGDEPLVLCDALTDEHLAELAGAAADNHRADGTVWLAVDPGPFGALLAAELGISGAHPPGPLLAVSGSATDLVRRQFEVLAEREEDLRFLDADVRRLAEPGYAAERARELAALLAGAGTVAVRTAARGADVVELPPERRREVPRRLARVVADALAAPGARPPSGLFVVGGEMTAALLDAVGARAFEVRGEVLPLAVSGALVGGGLDGTPAVTKGGLVGGADAAAECVSALRRAARERARGLRADLAE
ncbi:four-carbon acid sugar kinase family protein [Allonocardiopsis opalescens]|uniref:Uncharacterized protein YgbK (DUF1537 family) n=1 Tax=Allonocardiopsis opalescens TaxID=1144618 RepID=A0A2T0PW97_9ACTN|nr:four-carbon acid sugar kinase family protein [Allonocardiopsis opalescens]PRX95700.1 uncharacterized protein YgbK (DUF1537 family) [Allonocardiopsis opalescens]